MRIGLFTDGYLPQPNGVATSVLETAKELQKRGHEVYIIAPKYPGFRDASNVIRLTSVKIVKEPEMRVALNLPDRNLRKILSMDFDVIHGHSGGPITFLGREVARLKQVPFVVTYHTLWNRYTHYFLKGRIVTPKFIERVTRIFGNNATHIIAPSERVEKELQSYGIKKPISVIPSGIDIDKFANAKPGFLRKKTGLAKNPIMLFVGRLGKEKSIDFLIEVFKEVVSKEKNARFVLVGDGQERKNLETHAEKLGIADKVIFLGNLEPSQMHQVYKDATVFAFASTTETQGLVVPEALASGVPVVAIENSTFDIVENGKNGYLVKRDKKEFSSKVLSLIKDSKTHNKYSHEAVRSAEIVSISNTIDNLEFLYYSLVDRQNKESAEKIMKKNERREQIFVVTLFFWIAIVFSRLAVYFTYTESDPYPTFIFGESYFYHSSFGLVMILLSLALLIRRRTIGLAHLVFLGIGAGWVADELWAMLRGATLLSDYWSYYNLIPIFLFGFLPLLFIRKKNGDKMEFYISTKLKIHENPKNPRISVVIPAYNEGKFIASTLKSLLNQTHKEFELIVVDNNSKDDTAKVAKEFGAKVVFEKNPGVANARQAGCMAARGDIIATTDADAIVPANWLERILAEYEKDKKLVGFTGLSRLYSGPVTARAATRYLFSLFWKVDGVLSSGVNMLGSNMSFKRNAFKEIGGFNTDLTLGEDVDLAQRLKEKGKVSVDENLLVFASGRRFKDGLVAGILVYAPSWAARVLFRQEKFLTFPTVRTEKGTASIFSYLPLGIAVVIIITLFYFSNKGGN